MGTRTAVVWIMLVVVKTCVIYKLLQQFDGGLLLCTCKSGNAVLRWAIGKKVLC